MKSKTSKMLFLYVGEKEGTTFCDRYCDSCPIRFTCFTNKSIAYHITLDPKEKRVIRCEPDTLKHQN